jgi:hypothetical protein
MNFIFSDNVRILYLYCNIKSLKATAKLSRKSEANVVLIVVIVYSVKCTLILLPFLPSLKHESNTKKTTSWLVTA